MIKNYLVVGGSKGIGFAITTQLLAEGHHIQVLARSSEHLPKHDNLRYHEYDVLHDNLEEISLPETIHGLVYCPGSINLKPFRALKPAAFQKDFDINVLGLVKILQHVERKLTNSGSPSVVLFSTVAVAQGMPYHASVAASKGALEGLGKSLAAEWAPKVRVNIIAPSLTETPLAQKLLSSPERKESANQRHPLKRFGQPEDIASAACFLLSEKSSWITGQVIGVDGGLANLHLV